MYVWRTRSIVGLSIIDRTANARFHFVINEVIPSVF